MKHHFRKVVTVTTASGLEFTGRLMMVSPQSILLVVPEGQITLWRRDVEKVVAA